MTDREQQLEDFFAAYAARFNHALRGREVDVKGTVDAFASCFVGAGPAGVICGKNGWLFRRMIGKGFKFYKKAGTQLMTILRTEITLLDTLHAMVKVYWRSENVRPKDKAAITIDFEVFYFLQEQNGRLKIFAYITGDEQKALKDAGLIPA